jgi:hypothetical protein
MDKNYLPILGGYKKTLAYIGFSLVLLMRTSEYNII